jgi:hypothetical protein
VPSGSIPYNNSMVGKERKIMKKRIAFFASRILSASAKVFVKTNKLAISSPKAPKELRKK